MISPLPRPLNKSVGGFAFQPLAMQDPGAIWQGMFGGQLSVINRQTQRPRTHAQEGRRFGQIHPTDFLSILKAVAWDAVVTAERDYAFASPTIPPPGFQAVAIQDPGDQIVGTDARQGRYRLHH